LRSFLTALAATAGVTMPRRSIPGWLGRASATLVEWTWRILRVRRAPPLTRFAASMMSREITVQTGKAAHDLGYTPTIDVARGLAMLESPAPRPVGNVAAPATV